MSAQENAALLRRYLEALSQSDMDSVREAFAEDAVWHLPGNSPLAGDHKGPDAILEFIGRAFEMSGGTFRLELLDVMASDEHGVQWQRITAQREGKTLDEVEALTRAFKGMMSIHEQSLDGDGAEPPEDVDADVKLGDLEALRGVVKFPVRIKCATLSWNTLQQALDEPAAS